MQKASPKLAQCLVDLFHEMNKSIDYVVLRNYESLPEEWEHDIDILVREFDVANIRSYINDLIIEQDRPLNMQLLHRWNFWSINLEYKDMFCQIDLYNQMCKAWWIYADCEYILQQKRIHSGLFMVPLHEHELLLLAAKELFSYGYIRPHYHAKFTKINAKKLEEEAESLFLQYLPGKSVLQIVEAVINPEVSGRPIVTMQNMLNLQNLLFWGISRFNRFQQLRCEYR